MALKRWIRANSLKTFCEEIMKNTFFGLQYNESRWEGVRQRKLSTRAAGLQHGAGATDYGLRQVRNWSYDIHMSIPRYMHMICASFWFGTDRFRASILPQDLEVSKPRDSCLDFSKRCRGACQILKRCNYYNSQSRGFDIWLFCWKLKN